MCRLFISADSALWQSRTRSLRIDGMVTSVRLENYFWRVLDEIAERDNLNIPQMLTRLYHESIEAGHDIANFASFLRVCCMRYLELQLNGDVPRDRSVSISSLDVDSILSRETARNRQTRVAAAKP
jgi:predicted DNA-binding ribbon-helix-helix protein